MTLGARILGVAALLLCLLPQACRRGHDAAHLAQVDSLLRTTDSLIALMNAQDTTDLVAWNAAYLLHRERLVDRLNDTLDKSTALTLGNYHRLMDKTLARSRKEHPSVLIGLGTARRQLADLRNDVEKGLLEPAVEATYIEQERLALEAVAHNAGVVVNSYANARNSLRELAPAVDSLLTDTTKRVP
jgi:hypothetical protein